MTNAEIFKTLNEGEYFECLATAYRLALLQESGRLDKLELPESFVFKAPEPVHAIDFMNKWEQAAYYIFADGSLYFANNAQDEFWRDAADFVAEKLSNLDPESLDEMDKALIAWVG